VRIQFGELLPVVVTVDLAYLLNPVERQIPRLGLRE
jgi:hypothetical protein